MELDRAPLLADSSRTGAAWCAAYSDLIEASRAIHRFEKDGDIVFRDAISALFHDPAIDAKVILREKDILEDLEKAINRCDEVAETITNIAVKHA